MNTTIRRHTTPAQWYVGEMDNLVNLFLVGWTVLERKTSDHFSTLRRLFVFGSIDGTGSMRDCLSCGFVRFLHFVVVHVGDKCI